MKQRRPRRSTRRGGWLAAAALCVLCLPAAAQQVTQDFTLQPGWNAVFLRVLPEPNDPATVFAALQGRLESVWTWDPALSPADYIEDPAEADTMWNEDLWLRFFPAGEKALLTNLFAVLANRAYLVKIGGGAPVEWSVSGRPVLRRIRWAPDAFNLLGFPVDPAAPPSFGAFFAFAASHSPAQTYRLAAEGLWVPVEPGDPVRSGEAYWVFSEGMSDFNAPAEVILEDGDGLEYGAILEQRSVRLRNRTDAPMTVTVSQTGGSRELAYEAFDPVANGGVGGFVWPDLGGSLPLTLDAGGERVLRLGVRRALFAGHAFTTVVSFTDGLGTRWRAPLSAERASVASGAGAFAAQAAAAPAGTPTTGLWIGSATVNRVSEVNPPSADLSFDLELRLVGQRQLCAGGEEEGSVCSADVDCTGFDAAIECGDGNLCTGGPDVARACNADSDCANAGDAVARCVALANPIVVRGGGGLGRSRGAIWRYDADGVDLGAGWRVPAFDDTNWRTGAGEFGFGDADKDEDGAPDEATPLESTCRPPCALGAAERPPTYYFRNAFDVAALADWAVAPTEIQLELLADDGAVVWLNGNELARVNMPAGTPGFETSASKALSGEEEAPITRTVPLAGSGLILGGTNVLAVEVHQHESEVVHRQLVCRGGDAAREGLNCSDDSDCGGGGCVAERIEQIAQTTPTVLRTGGSEAQLRLILHVDGSGQARILKQAIQMWQDGDEGPPVVPGRYVLLTDDSRIPAFKGVAVRSGALVGRRFSATALDFADADPECPGCLALASGVGKGGGPALTGTAVLPASHPTNPYHHRFHPDHDDLDADFEPIQLPADFDPATDPSPLESFEITREIELEFDAFDSDSEEFMSGALGWGDSELGGIYRERLTGLHRQPIHVEGTFRLVRPPSSRIADLNPAPGP